MLCNSLTDKFKITSTYLETAFVAHGTNVSAFGEVLVVNSPAVESAANMEVEHAIQSVQEQIRSIKFVVLADAHRVRSSHCASLGSYLVRRAQGQRIRGRSRMSSKAQFGVQMLYKLAKTKTSNGSRSHDRGEAFG